MSVIWPHRFFCNDRVSEAEILAGHCEATRARLGAHDGPVLVLRDTTEFSFTRESTAAAGFAASVNGSETKAGGKQVHTGSELLLRASLVITRDVLPLGLAAAKQTNRAAAESHEKNARAGACYGDGAPGGTCSAAG